MRVVVVTTLTLGAPRLHCLLLERLASMYLGRAKRTTAGTSGISTNRVHCVQPSAILTPPPQVLRLAL
jgi:hypothetical protein